MCAFEIDGENNSVHWMGVSNVVVEFLENNKDKGERRSARLSTQSETGSSANTKNGPQNRKCCCTHKIPATT
eukprot:TRINITY_DN5277_c0_g1_i1.p2 TRINITY_DN5277_c0_g1~~TRINITY_DN5277_c0_g1_i1.p2  ORF type:complete len:72 (-),score=13.70 TRINITY_DN5277_c0_g1_i1:621-836(-)